VAGDDFMDRIDEHMRRGNEYMRRGNELMAEVREEVRLTREDVQRRDEQSRTFMQEITARVERIGREELRQLHDQGTLIRRQSEVLLEVREEVRAQTQAIFRLLDRFGPEPNGA
jgi:hypothetical protein